MALKTILFRQVPLFRPATAGAANTSLKPLSIILTQNNEITSYCPSTQKRPRFASPSHIASPRSMSSTTTSKRLPASSKTLLITEACKKRLIEILDEKDTFLRVSVEGGGCSGFQYKFGIDKKFEDDDTLLHATEDDKRILVVIDETSLDILRGSTLDYEMELIRAAFKIINNPKAEQGCSCGRDESVVTNLEVY